MKDKKLPVTITEKGVSAVIRKVARLKASKTQRYFIVNKSGRANESRFDVPTLPRLKTSPAKTASKSQTVINHRWNLRSLRRIV